MQNVREPWKIASQHMKPLESGMEEESQCLHHLRLLETTNNQQRDHGNGTAKWSQARGGPCAKPAEVFHLKWWE